MAPEPLRHRRLAIVVFVLVEAHTKRTFTTVDSLNAQHLRQRATTRCDRHAVITGAHEWRTTATTAATTTEAQYGEVLTKCIAEHAK